MPGCDSWCPVDPDFPADRREAVSAHAPGARVDRSGRRPPLARPDRPSSRPYERRRIQISCSCSRAGSRPDRDRADQAGLRRDWPRRPGGTSLAAEQADVSPPQRCTNGTAPRLAHPPVVGFQLPMRGGVRPRGRTQTRNSGDPRSPLLPFRLASSPSQRPACRPNRGEPSIAAGRSRPDSACLHLSTLVTTERSQSRRQQLARTSSPASIPSSGRPRLSRRPKDGGVDPRPLGRGATSLAWSRPWLDPTGQPVQPETSADDSRHRRTSDRSVGPR